MTIPMRFVQKVGSKYYIFSLKGRYDERDEREDSLHFGRKIVAKKEAEDYKRWQNRVNNAHAVVKKYGPVYVVYIRGRDAFRSMKDATDYLTFSKGFKLGDSPRKLYQWLADRGYPTPPGFKKE